MCREVPHNLRWEMQRPSLVMHDDPVNVDSLLSAMCLECNSMYCLPAACRCADTHSSNVESLILYKVPIKACS